MAKNFRDLSEREILALAVSLEEEDGKIYGEFAEALREDYPATSRVLEEMQQEESEHRASLIAIFRRRFGSLRVGSSAASNCVCGFILC